MESGITQPFHPSHRAVHERLGRNLLVYQQIEQSLKLLVPYTHADGSKSGESALARMRRDIDGKSLGPVIQLFKESLAHDKPEDAALFEEALARILESRNEMAHRFLLTPGIDLKTEAGCKRAAQWLDDRYKEAHSVAVLVLANGLVLASALGAITEEEAKHAFEVMGGQLEIVEEPGDS
jgi:hypothetical protein